jgi:hypothetical protein
MLFSEIVKAVETSHIARQLVFLKRCFGHSAKVGIVTSPRKVDYFGTIAELVAMKHISGGLEWIDPFLEFIPKVSEFPIHDFLLVSDRYSDGGPPSPWDVAKRKQVAARARADNRREYRRKGG